LAIKICEDVFTRSGIECPFLNPLRLLTLEERLPIKANDSTNELEDALGALSLEGTFIKQSFKARR
jgi:hypothetical protein